MEENAKRAPAPRELHNWQVPTALKEVCNTSGLQSSLPEMQAMDVQTIESVAEQPPHLRQRREDHREIVQICNQPAQPPHRLGIVKKGGLLPAGTAPILWREDDKNGPDSLARRQQRQSVNRQ